MKRHPRLLRFAKWSGLLASFVVILAWAISLRWTVAYVVRNGPDCLVIVLGGSIIFCSYDVVPLPSTGTGWHLSAPWSFLGKQPYVDFAGYPHVIFIPLWSLLIVLAVPTAILWWRDRRTPKGNCEHCDYNLTGNISGQCPECGATIPLSRAIES